MMITRFKREENNMVSVAMSYIKNPFPNFFGAIVKAYEKQGMARAAYELRRLGYYDAAEQALKRMREID